jgi:hypothetical protein
MHGRTLARFLACAGRPVPKRPADRTTMMDHVERILTATGA